MAENIYKICENCGHPLLNHNLLNEKNVTCSWPKCKCKCFKCDGIVLGEK